MAIFVPNVMSYNDYYPFEGGTYRKCPVDIFSERASMRAGMSTRHESSDGYSYGFNGMEKDDEVEGQGNSYTATFWQYSDRLGRRWNIDPVIKHNASNYLTFSNNPIIFIDPLGNTDYYGITNGEWLGSDGIENGKKLVVLTIQTQNEIKETTSNNEYITLNQSSYRDIIPLASEIEIAGFDAVFNEYERSSKEAAYSFGIKNGEIGGIPSKGKTGHVNPFPSIVNLNRRGYLYLYTAHLHPIALLYSDGTGRYGPNDNTPGFRYAMPVPSTDDKKAAVSSSQPDVILGFEINTEEPLFIRTKRLAIQHPNTLFNIDGSDSFLFDKKIAFFDENGLIIGMQYSLFKQNIEKIRNDDANIHHKNDCQNDDNEGN